MSKTIILLLITLTTFTNVSYASFPVVNELTEISDQIHDTKLNSKLGPLLLYLFGGGGLIALAFLLYWSVKNLLLMHLINENLILLNQISVLVSLLLLIGLYIWLNQVNWYLY